MSSQNEDRKEIVLEWWEDLKDHNGERAQLKRCGSIDQIFSGAGPMFIRLCQKFGYWKSNYPEALAILAALLARVKTNDERASFPAQLASPMEGSNRVAMSELRFQHLQKANDWDELFIRLRRAVDLLKGNVNINSLTDIIFRWAEKIGGRTDKKAVRQLPFELAEGYYSKLPKQE